VVQLLFAIVWTAATLAAGVVSMRKIREAGKWEGRNGKGVITKDPCSRFSTFSPQP
jgi:hypothetical protein